MPVITAEEAAAFDNAYLLKQHVKTLIQAEIANWKNHDYGRLLAPNRLWLAKSTPSAPCRRGF